MANNYLASSFLFLSIVACVTLWGVFVWNGAFASMNQCISDGILADGTPLRRTYTGTKPLDGFLVNMVLFTMPVASESFSIGLFLINLTGELTLIIAIFTVEGHVGKNFRNLGQFATIWLMAFQAVGGALIVPLYFFSQLRWPAPRAPRRSIPISVSRVLLPSIVLGYVLPGVMEFNSSNLSLTENQLWVGLYQLFPLLIPTARLALSRILDTVSPPKEYVTTNSGSAHLVVLYIFTAFVSTVTRLYVAAGLLGGDESSLWDIFVPNTQASSFEQKVLAFLPFDYAIIMISLSLWTWNYSREKSLLANWGLTMLIVILLGPGAVFGLARASYEWKYQR